MGRIDRIRNIGVVAHIDAGKTTVSERFLHHTGKIHRVGEVHDGSTQLDWMPEERERGITITAAATTLPWKGCEIHLIDTPGHVDFTIEVERSLRVLDGAVVVFCAVGGVEPQSETVWRQADKFHVPRLAFVNKMDRLGADFDKVVEEIRQRLSAPAVPLVVPFGSAEQFDGVVDLVHMRGMRFSGEIEVQDTIEPIPPGLEEAARAARSRLIEALADHDDRVAEAYLEGRDPEQGQLVEALRKAVIARQIVPVLCGAALRNKGIRPLLDAIVAYLPSPADLPPVRGVDPRDPEREGERPPRDDAPLAALAFKVAMDEGRKVVYLRVFSGTLEPGMAPYNPRLQASEKIARLFLVHADRRERVDRVGAGSIVVASGLKLSTTGDTLCSESEPLLLERIDSYEPVISIAIEPRSQAAKKKLDLALSKMVEEDPTFRVHEDPDTGQTLISGMGELHLEIIVERLQREYGVEAGVGKPQVVYHETISGSAEERALFERELKEATLFGDVRCAVRPLARGSGLAILSAVPDDAKPRALVDSGLAGLAEAAQSGPEGFPMTDLEATLLDLSYRDEAQPEVGVKVAAGEAFRRAVSRAGPLVLEPIMSVNVLTPEEHLGPVIGDLRQRRAQIHDIGAVGELRRASARVALRAMFGYSTELRSLTKGRATFTMEFHSYDNLETPGERVRVGDEMRFELLFDGPQASPDVVVLAHGAGAPMDSPFLDRIARDLAHRGIRVVRFEFPYMERRRLTGRSGAPDRTVVLERRWLEVIEDLGGGERLVLGGKSLGGRIASHVADRALARGLVCLGYPFHPPGQPERLRTAHLATLSTPTLILQGTRDPFGTPAEIGSYGLAPTIRVEFVPDGDHSLAPRARSGHSLDDNMALAVERIAAFVATTGDVSSGTGI